MTAKRLAETFKAWSGTGQPLVLASVCETEGSTYSKTGEQMLVSGDGNFQGMLSGGCLEGDLAERARDVIENGKPQLVTYDLRADEDGLWGLGVGCDGMIRVFLQRLEKTTAYEPYASMCKACEGTDWQVAATVLHSDAPGLNAGAAVVLHEGEAAWSDVAGQYRDELVTLAIETLPDRRSRSLAVDIGGHASTVLVSVLRPYPRVLVLGAGIDAIPLVRLIAEMGWRASVSDHRPAYVENGDFSLAESVACVAATDLSRTLEIDQFDAAVVMSHHLVTDETYLRMLAASDVPYIGLLGPPHRRERLLRKLGDAGQSLDGRLHGPAGIDINASGAASIALSIVAEMHRAIMGT